MTLQPLYPEHAIRCPWCHAPAGQRCTGKRGRRLAIASHDTRITAWNNSPTSQPSQEPTR